MKTWETICNIEKNNTLDTIFSRKMKLRSSMMPSLLCSLRSSFRGPGSRRYRPSSPASMVPRIISVFVPSPLPLCFFVRYTSSFVMHPGSGLCFFHDRRLNHTIRPSTAAFPSLPPSPAYTPGAMSTHQLSTTVSSASAHAPNRLTCLRLKRWHVLLSQGGCVPNEHRADPTPPPHHGQGRGGSKKESSSLWVSPALHPPERPSPRRADIADHGLGRETRERRYTTWKSLLVTPIRS